MRHVHVEQSFNHFLRISHCTACDVTEVISPVTELMLLKKISRPSPLHFHSIKINFQLRNSSYQQKLEDDHFSYIEAFVRVMYLYDRGTFNCFREGLSINELQCDSILLRIVDHFATHHFDFKFSFYQFPRKNS